MRTRTQSKLLISAAFGAIAGIALILIVERALLNAPTSEYGAPGASKLTQPGHVGTDSFADAVARAAPSVVNIFTAKVTTERQTMAFKDPLLQRYFGNLLPEQTRKRMETSLGSGVIVSADGYVLTNFHILEDADEIKVELPNGSNVPVLFVGNDPETDLAILKMDVAKAPAIPIGNIRKLRVGDLVLAIGNPFGVGQTVTMGIVSATGRSHLGISTFENFIQTDAAINPGNSGGALINNHGELIGINTAIFSKSGGSHGIGFAIPANLAINVLDQIVRRGRVVRGWIGITGQDVTPELAESFGLRDEQGVLVSGVLEDGPAEDAGLRPGDVITHVDNQVLMDIHDLMEAIANAGPEAQLNIGVWRGNERLELATVTSERPKMPK